MWDYVGQISNGEPPLPDKLTFIACLQVSAVRLSDRDLPSMSQEDRPATRRSEATS